MDSLPSAHSHTSIYKGLSFTCTFLHLDSTKCKTSSDPHIEWEIIEGSIGINSSEHRQQLQRRNSQIYLPFPNGFVCISHACTYFYDTSEPKCSLTFFSSSSSLLCRMRDFVFNQHRFMYIPLNVFHY